MLPYNTRSTLLFSQQTALRARHNALPAEYGAWVLLLSPLVIGLAAG